MKDVSIVVPVWNEEGNIVPLIKRISDAFASTSLSFEVICIDDFSTDKTHFLIKQVQKQYPILYFLKKGKKGKAYSLYEGIQKAQGELIAILDADLQYPPEAIVEMIKKIKSEHIDILVANRIVHKDNAKIRQFLSKSFRKVFGEYLFGLKVDVQSGLKVFKKSVYENLGYYPKSGWTFDLEILHKANQAGFVLGSFDIPFTRRAHGKSKVSSLTTSFEIGLNALQLKSKPLNPLALPPTQIESMRGAGVGFKKKAYITHTTLSHSSSAIKTLVTAQRLVLFAILGLTFVSLLLKPLTTAQIIVGILSFIYFLDTLFNFYLVMKSLHNPQEIITTQEEIRYIDTRMLPVYTILCPLYKEAHVVSQFLEAIGKLDYPKVKLDVLLLLEEDDKETIEFVQRMDLPGFVRIIVVPHSLPKTKPKACNYGLSFAKGEYLVIYDAEDMPDPLQLKKAFLAFQKVGKNVLCLQAKLNYYNPHQNLLTRFFTAEYSLWFDITLTGMQAVNTSIPLGGTSNHFRTKDLQKLQGWDPFNVTEDADLGIRLFKRGYQTAIIDSVTYEEANSNVWNWIRQRSRWIKGYMQTYLVHTRDAVSFAKESPYHSFLFHLSIGGKIAFILINPFLWLATVSYFVLYRLVGPTIESLYPSYVFYMALFSLVFGNFMFVYYYMLGSAKREQWSLIKYIYLIPFYWLLISLSGFIALYQLIFKPHYWEKTIHGFHLQKNVFSKVVVSVEQVQEGFVIPQFFKTRLSHILEHKNIYLGATLLLVALAVGNLINFVFNAYLGRILDFDEFSLLSLLGGFVSIAAIFTAALGSTVNYRAGFIIGRFGENYAISFWKYVRKYALAVGTVIFLLWIIITPFLKGFFNTDEILIFVLFSSVLLIGFAAAVDRAFISAELLFGYLASVMLIEPIVKLGLAFILVELGLKEYAYISVPLGDIAAFFLGWMLILNLKRKRPAPKEPIPEKELHSFPIKFYIVSLLSGLSNISFLSLDVILARHFLTPDNAGMYAFISLSGKMIYFLGQMTSPFIMPFVSRNEGANKGSEKVFYISLIATIFLLLSGYIVFGIFGFLSLPILFGNKVIPIIPYVSYFGLGIVFFSIANVFTTYYLSKKIYTFPLIGFVLSLVEVFLIALFHRNITDIVSVMFLIGLINCTAMIILHLNKRFVVIIESNFVDLLGLFIKERQDRKQENSQKAILIFNWRDTKHKWAGGAEVYVHEIAKRWVQNGHKVTLFCGNDGNHIKYEVVDGIEVFRRGGFYFVYIWAFLYYIVKFRGKFDIIIDCENGIPFFTPLFAKERIYLLIHHVHQEVFRKSLRIPFVWLAEFLELTIMPAVYKNTQVITVSPSSKDDIIKHKLTDKEPIVIYNGVDPNLYKPGKKSKNPVVLYVGRLQYYKSLHVFIKAAKRVLETLPHVEFIIAGEGGEKNKLIQYAKKLGLENNIQFTGRVNLEEKITLMQKAWVFVNPSFMEGWGITTIEANACGTPAIASNVPGLKDSIKNPHTGILVTYGDHEKFAQHIIRLIRNRRFRKILSEESIKWAQNFTWDKSSSKGLEVLLDNYSVTTNETLAESLYSTTL